MLNNTNVANNGTNTAEKTKNERSAQPDLIMVCEDAVSRLSAEAIYSQYSHDFKADHTGKLRGRPPFRDSKSGTSFTVFPDKGFFDAGDNFGGSPIDYIHSMRVGRWERAKGFDWVDALKELCQLAGVEFPESNYQPDDIEARRRWLTRQEVLRHAYEYCHQVLFNPVLLKPVQAKEYLHERQINDDTIRKLQIGFYDSWVNLSNYLISKGFTPEEIKKTGLQRGVFMTDDGVKISETKCSWENFITIPWLDEQGKPLTLYGRYYQKKPENPNTPKTLALPGKGTKKVPFLFHIVKQNNHREVVSVEGLFDAIALYQEGMTNVCSPIAASFSNEQIDCLVRNRIERVTHIGDPDGGGDGGTLSNLKRLSQLRISVYVPERLPDGLDPDEFVAKYGVDALNELIKKSIHGLRWLARFIITQHELNNDAGIEALLKACARKRKEFKHIDDTVWDIYFNCEVRNNMGMDVETFRQKIENQFNKVEEEDRENHANVNNFSQSAIADSIGEKYREQLAWDVSIQKWRSYSAEIKGVWSSESVEVVREIVKSEITLICNQIDPNKDITFNIVQGVEKLLRGVLAVKKWDYKTNLLPFSNGVLDLDTRTFSEHNPGYRLTWSLPYAYNLLAICNPITDWLKEMTQGDDGLINLIRAFLHGCVTARTDWQQFLELIGPGGTGKSTIIRLAQALVGVRNTHTTSLKKLEGSRFETACIKDKRLVVITDSERYSGSVSTLKALTGQDSIPYEVKFVQSQGGFVPNAMVILAANEIIQSGDYTSGLERRRITVPLTHKIHPSQQRNLITVTDEGIRGEFAPYIPGLLNWVLALDGDEATQIVRNWHSQSDHLARQKAETLVSTNPLADWADHWLVLRDGYRSPVGIAKQDKNNKSKHWYQKTDEWIYANYCEYSRAVGTKPVALRRFVNLLDDLCVNQLGLDVKHGRDRKGSYFQGLKIRDEFDHDPLLISGDDDPNSPPPNNPPPNTPPPPPPPTTPCSTPPGGDHLHTTQPPNHTDQSIINKQHSILNSDGKIPARDSYVTDSVTDETPSGDKSQRCDSKIKNPSPTGEEVCRADRLGNKKESEGDFPVTQPESITSEDSNCHNCCNGDGKMLSQGEGSCSTPHGDYERKPKVGDRNRLIFHRRIID